MENEKVNLQAPKDLYLVWQGAEDEQFYNQYTSLVDAVSSEEKGALIFKANLESLGSFELITKLVKNKKRKK